MRRRASILAHHVTTCAVAPVVEALEQRRLLSAGQLDPSFGAGGIALNDLGSGGSAFGNAMALQADGKVLVAGKVRGTTGDDLAVARFLANGQVDASFGVNGVVVVDLGSNQDAANAIAVQADGKIIVAGQTVTNLHALDFAVVRFNADGSLDGSFGNGGKVV